ncbi:MAG TPA: DUF167 domain-containing protein [Phycisphaerales bacterium]|nr:DUF167 domain-containing protein [Phycisphaerales bacterium]
MPPIVQPLTTGGGDGRPAVSIAVKAVPGASRDAVAGVLGDRLKVRVSAPPEDGKANRAIEALLASACGLHTRDATVVAGHTRPEKTVQLRGIDEASARRLLGL